MIWNSHFFMTFIDLFIMAIGIYVGFQIHKNRINNPMVKGSQHQLLISAGLFLIVILFVADLFTMWVLPQYIGMKMAMSNMEFLHLNISWLITPIALCFIAVGFLRGESALTQYQANLEKKVEVRTEELNNAMEEARNANRAKSEFLSSMSHELRTPMNAVMGFAEMLNINPREPLSKKQQSYVNHILKGGRHLMELIDDVLALSQIEAGKLSINFDDIPAHKIIDESLQLIRIMAQEKGIEIVDQITRDEFLILWTDGTRLTQVLLNLLSNAVKYNRKGGTVTLTCQETSNHLLRISIADTGLGIAEIEQQNLFKSFERLGRETGDIEGTGIGLVVTKRMIELLGGKIGYQSKEGKGSTFWIEVPMSHGQNHTQKKTEALGV